MKLHWLSVFEEFGSIPVHLFYSGTSSVVKTTALMLEFQAPREIVRLATTFELTLSSLKFM
jgi:hypothetical protein